MRGVARLQAWRQRHYDSGFIRAVHYFGDGWPINCWSTMTPQQARRDFATIAEDGFNTVILVVPWRGFQVEQFPPRYEDAYFKLLKQLLKEAARAKLWVILRVSYSHHICDEARLISKHLTAGFLTDAAFEAPWLHYLRRLRRLTRFHANLYGSFICWEEFWHGLMRFTEESQETRKALAAKTGYCDFMADKESIIPLVSSPEFEHYQRFINTRLRDIFELGASQLPRLGYEFRVDKDPLHNLDGSVSWLANDYLLDSSDTRYSYWAPFIGAANEGEQLSAEQALALLDYNLDEQTGQGRDRKLIIDQFNFVDDTFKYTGQNARLALDQIPTFLDQCAEHLPRYCQGYGIWAWRDYHQNHLFNPGFHMGLRGWRSHGGVVGEGALTEDGLCLQEGDELGQDFGGASHGMHRKYKTGSAELHVYLAAPVQVMLEASLDGENYVPLMSDGGGSQHYCELPIDDPVYGARGALFRLRVQRGSGVIRSVSLFQYAYRVGIREVGGEAGPFLEPLRSLNQKLLSSS